MGSGRGTGSPPALCTQHRPAPGPFTSPCPPPRPQATRARTGLTPGPPGHVPAIPKGTRTPLCVRPERHQDPGRAHTTPTGTGTSPAPLQTHREPPGHVSADRHRDPPGSQTGTGTPHPPPAVTTRARTRSVPGRPSRSRPAPGAAHHGPARPHGAGPGPAGRSAVPPPPAGTERQRRQPRDPARYPGPVRAASVL